MPHAQQLPLENSDFVEADQPNKTNVQGQVLLVNTLINTVPKGDALVMMSDQQEIYVSLKDYQRWNLPEPQDEHILLFQGRRYVYLKSIPNVNARFRLKDVTLLIKADPKVLPVNKIHLLGEQNKQYWVQPEKPSVIWNYNWRIDGDKHFNEPNKQLGSEIIVRQGRWLFQNTMDYTHRFRRKPQTRRLQSKLVYENRTHLQKYTFGDQALLGSDVLSTVPMTGLGVRKLYSMDPYATYRPTASLTAEVELPSTLEVRVGNKLVQQQEVLPGTVDVTGILGPVGQQDVSLTLRDSLGRLQQVNTPFYFGSYRSLAKGLHEYHYQLGLLGRSDPDGLYHYQTPGVNFFHRYGLMSQFNIGAQGQWMLGGGNMGPLFNYEHPILGEFQAAYSLSHGSMRNKSKGKGDAYALSYERKFKRLDLRYAQRFVDQDFYQLSHYDQREKKRFSRRSRSASAYWRFDADQSTSFRHTVSHYGRSSYQTNGLSYLTSILNREGNLTVSYQRVENNIHKGQDHRVDVSLYYRLGRYKNFNSQFRNAKQQRIYRASISDGSFQDLGVSYTLGAQHLEGKLNHRETNSADVHLQWKNRLTNINFDLDHAHDPLYRGRGSMAVAGSVVYADNNFGITRPIRDGFAFVNVGTLSGVKVYNNGRYLGVTNDKGQVLVTNLSAYHNNAIRFSGDQLPLNYRFPSKNQIVSPGKHMGLNLSFVAEKHLAVYGQLFNKNLNAFVELTIFDVLNEKTQKASRSFTAMEGTFYLDNVKPGRTYTLRLLGESACQASFHVPDTDKFALDLGVLTCQ